MTIQEFIAFWQAQPFRPFRMHAARGAFDIGHPLQVGITPTLRVALVIDGTRTETFALDDLITHRVTCANLSGATTLGQLQALVRHVRGVPWMLEDLPKCLAKGSFLPRPQ